MVLQPTDSHIGFAHEIQICPLSSGAQFLVIIFHPRSLVIITDLSVVSTISLPQHQINPAGSYVWSKHLPSKGQHFMISAYSLFIQRATPIKPNIKGLWFSCWTNWQCCTSVGSGCRSGTVGPQRGKSPSWCWNVSWGDKLLARSNWANSMSPVQSKGLTASEGQPACHISATISLDGGDKY